MDNLTEVHRDRQEASKQPEMKTIITWCVKKFFNIFYKVKPPESVSYYKKAEAARARLVKAPHGGLQMEIKGEKYKFEGFPRGHVLVGPLAKLKKKVKDMVFNQVFAEIEKMASEMEHDMLPAERMCPAVKEINRGLEELEHMEVVEDMKGRIRLIRKVLTFFLQEDDAYRFRAQHFLSNLDKKKVALSKADKYYARGKYWKVDYQKFDY